MAFQSIREYYTDPLPAYHGPWSMLLPKARFCTLSGKSGAYGADCSVLLVNKTWFISAYNQAGSAGHWCKAICVD